MGIFANMRRNDDDELEGLESSDEWLRDLTDDEDDMVSLDDLTSLAPSPQQAPPADPADLPPPASGQDVENASGLWHFPDLDAHGDQPVGSLDLANQAGHDAAPVLSARAFDFNPDVETAPDTLGQEHPELLGFDDRRSQEPAAWAQPTAADQTALDQTAFDQTALDQTALNQTVFDRADGPCQPVAPELLAALGLEPNPTWDQVALAHAQAVHGADDDVRRGANISYAALRLLAAD